MVALREQPPPVETRADVLADMVVCAGALALRVADARGDARRCRLGAHPPPARCHDSPRDVRGGRRSGGGREKPARGEAVPPVWPGGWRVGRRQTTARQTTARAVPASPRKPAKLQDDHQTGAATVSQGLPTWVRYHDFWNLAALAVLNALNFFCLVTGRNFSAFWYTTML
eukprot:356323-Chlamydomonas_euryale.AAC.7